MNKIKKMLIVIMSLVLLLVVSLTNNYFVTTNEDGDRFFGFPANWLAIYPYDGLGFLWIGFIVYIVFFYFIILLLINFTKKVTKIREK